MIKSFEDNLNDSPYWSEFYNGLNERDKKKVKSIAMMSLISAIDWLHKNRRNPCPCPDCDHETYLNDSLPCKNQHIKDLVTIMSYWDHRITEDEFKKRMTIGYDFINDEWI